MWGDKQNYQNSNSKMINNIQALMTWTCFLKDRKCILTRLKSWGVNWFMCVWMTRRKKNELRLDSLGAFPQLCVHDILLDTWPFLPTQISLTWASITKIVIAKLQLRIYYLPGTFLSTLHVVTHLFLTRIQWGKYHYFPHCTGVGIQPEEIS